MTSMQVLPREMLVEIFSHYVQSEGHENFLRHIPLVCTDWNDVSSTPSLWSNIETRNPNFLVHLSRKGSLYHTQSLKFDPRCNERFSDSNLSQVLKNIRDLKALEMADNNVNSNAIMLVAEHCPNLERLHFTILKSRNNTTSHEWNQFLTVCGPTLKHLHLSYHCSQETGQQLVSGIAAKCPILETLKFYVGDGILFPIHELRSGCPRLRELQFSCCRLITDGRDDSLGRGFINLKKFIANYSDFGGLNIYSLMKNSVDLEHLKLFYNVNLVFGNISKIPTGKVRYLSIAIRDPDKDLKVFRDAVFKWRHTLLDLHLRLWKGDIVGVLEHFMNDNPYPQLKSLSICDTIHPHLFEKLLQQCQNLSYLHIKHKFYKGRENVKTALEFLKGENGA